MAMTRGPKAKSCCWLLVVGLGGRKPSPSQICGYPNSNFNLDLKDGVCFNPSSWINALIAAIVQCSQ